MALLRSALLLLALLLVVFLANKELAGVDAVTEGQYHLDRAGGHGSGSLKGFHNQGIELTLAAPSEAHFPLSSLVTSLSSALSLFSTLTLSLSLPCLSLSNTGMVENRVRRAVRSEVLEDAVQEAVPLLLQ